MKIILAIGTGSFIGGIGRYLLFQFIQTRFVSAFPFGTLAVNIIGCFLMGVVFGIGERSSLDPQIRLFLATGILGGFTTFSAFSNETFGLIRYGQFWLATSYVLASVILGVLATWLGYILMKMN